MSELEPFKKHWDPFRELSPFPRWMDRWMADFQLPATPARFGKVGDVMALSPSVEVQESRDHYDLKFDLPGLSKDQIKIDLHNNTLTVSGERKQEKKEEGKDKRVHYSEVSYGSFSRSFTFPEPVMAEKAEATFENGVLKMTLPKVEVTNKRQISVK